MALVKPALARARMLAGLSVTMAPGSLLLLEWGFSSEGVGVHCLDGIGLEGVGKGGRGGALSLTGEGLLKAQSSVPGKDQHTHTTSVSAASVLPYLCLS